MSINATQASVQRTRRAIPPLFGLRDFAEYMIASPGQISVKQDSKGSQKLILLAYSPYLPLHLPGGNNASLTHRNRVMPCLLIGKVIDAYLISHCNRTFVLSANTSHHDHPSYRSILTHAPVLYHQYLH